MALFSVRYCPKSSIYRKRDDALKTLKKILGNA